MSALVQQPSSPGSPESSVPTAGISETNPAGTHGFEFVEYTAEDTAALGRLFEQLGFRAVARHRSKAVTLYRQNDTNFIVNQEPDSFAQAFARAHGPSACAMAFRVADAAQAFERAIGLGAEAFEGRIGPMELNIPAIKGIGGSLIYLVDRATTPSIYDIDIEGKLTGLKSRAMTSPCGQIRIPINESCDDKSQIEEYLAAYKGEGIQHIALASEDIYGTVEALIARGVPMMDPPPDAYYAAVDERLPDHGEDLERLKDLGILIDGAPGGGLLLQIFTKTVIGPIFFEIIQRRGDEGFGEGNFQALFEAMERDQVERGMLDNDAEDGI
jgi:4-hydroxyphenylpyruvate dioxygenase